MGNPLHFIQASDTSAFAALHTEQGALPSQYEALQAYLKKIGLGRFGTLWAEPVTGQATPAGYASISWYTPLEGVGSDLFDAFELVAVGGKEKKDRVMSDKERKIVSYHEVGHAMVTALQKNTEPVQKITIVPRTMGALGYTLQTPEEEKYLQTKDELLAKITTYMAGRAPS